MQKNNKNEKPQKQKFKFDLLFLIVLILGIIGIISLVNGLSKKPVTNISYNTFETKLKDGSITGDVIAKPVTGQNYGYKITGTYKNKLDNEEISYSVIVSVENLDNLIELAGTDADHDGIKDYNFDIVINEVTESVWLSILISFIPYLIIAPIFIYLMYKLMKSSGASGAMDFGKSTAKLSRSKTVTFNDVAGCDEEKEELVEIIDFLKNPRKYNEIGARIPKGVLLFGPPGTGKTLLAKAVAGEAGVPFFSISGSDFVEMFVGVGASRVRDMFKTAKQNAPCIIFIDEIDAVGRQRGAGMGGGHDEREQTLNQLLVEMDGFAPNLGIIVMAATNRPDVLDPALLRPGRFDRQITINNPDVRGREAILKVHARNKHLDASVKLDAIAQRTPGFSGADIENLLNEAALLAARDNRKVISTQDIDEAIDRVMMGPAKKSHKYTPKEMRMVAYHEAGHAVIGLKLKNASIVQKVTIIPRGQAGGYNLMMPKEETFTQSKSELLESITGYLGGRVAEELMFNEISTGAYGDIKSATRIARAMVAEYGMSDLGPVQYEQQAGSVFLGRDYLKDKNFSDAIAQEIDVEVRKIIFECHEQATTVVKENMELLKNIAEYLLKVETLNKNDIEEIEQTGHLAWYDKKEAEKAALEAEEKAQEPKAEEPTDIQDVTMPEEININAEESKEEEPKDSTDETKE